MVLTRAIILVALGCAFVLAEERTPEARLLSLKKVKMNIFGNAHTEMIVLKGGLIFRYLCPFRC